MCVVHGVSKGCYAHVLETSSAWIIYKHMYKALNEWSGQTESRSPLYHTTIYSVNKSQIWEESPAPSQPGGIERRRTAEPEPNHKIVQKSR